MNAAWLTLVVATLGQAPAASVLTGPPGDLRRSPVVAVVERAGPAVVNIGADVITRQNPFARGGRSDDPFWNRFGGGRRRSRRSQSLGSGVIIDATGLVLTNEHVVSRATDITVTLADRRAFSAEVVGADPEFDIAVLKILDAKDLPVAERGVSGDLMPGEPVVAIGNPFGLSNSVTTGVVSALHRSIEADSRVYEDFVQTDAAINPGNSGGALLNIEGRLIGINTAIYRSGTGIGFAIPIDRAMAVVEEVLRYGEVRPAFVGMLVDPESESGAEVLAVFPSSPAWRAGLRAGDVLVDVGGQEVKSGRSFWQMERSFIPGRAVTVTFERAGASRRVMVEVRELAPRLATTIGRARLGLEVKERRGSLVITKVEAESSAARIGVRKGDRLLALGGQRLRGLRDFEGLCAAAYDAPSILAHIGRGRRSYPVSLRLSLDRLPAVP